MFLTLESLPMCRKMPSQPDGINAGETRGLIRKRISLFSIQFRDIKSMNFIKGISLSQYN